MKRFLIVVLCLFSAASYAAGPWVLLVPSADVPSMMWRLDALIVPTETTKHYAEVISAVNPPVYPFALLTIDERAQSILTPEEWAGRLATMPVEFVRPLP